MDDIQTSVAKPLGAGRRFRFPACYHDHLHADANINYQLNRFLGEEEEHDLRALGASIHDLADWKREMKDRAVRAEAAGETARACRYHRAAEFFMAPGDPEKERAYDRFIALFNELHGGTLERLTIPYGAHTLSAIRLRAAAPRGMVVMHAGFDAFIEEFYPFGEALEESGFDVVMFDGPGQGEALVKQRLPMTHAWEAPVGAVLDSLGASDVTLLGISLGGYLAPRAAAFDARVTRVVAFDAMYDFFAAAMAHTNPWLNAVVRPLLGTRATRLIVDAVARSLMTRDFTVDWGIRQGMYVTGTRSPSEFLRSIESYTLRDVAATVTADVLILAGSEDHHVPADQFERQIRACTSARSVTARRFTRAEGGHAHCQIGRLDLVASTIAHWIQERTDARRSA
jgi:alpha-beta hydrolase superfamily lysophospholipase